MLSLRKVAASIFALCSLLPMLLVIALLWGDRLMERTDVQVSLLLALVLALLGFLVFRGLTDRIAHLATTLHPSGAGGAARPGGDQPVSVPGLGPVAEIGQIATAFGQLLEELRASTTRLEDLVFKLGTLNQIAELAAHIPTIKDLLSVVLERTMRTVGATIGSIMLVDPERQVLRIAASRGLPEAIVGRSEVKLGEGIAGKVAQLGEPVLVDDIETDPRFARANDPKYGVGSFICMPIRVGDRIIGVVNLAKSESHPDRRAFTPTDLQFLNTLMTHMAYAVENARLLDDARTSAEHLQHVVEDQQLRLTLAQQQMVHTEKLSALGQLVAGVAHELSNPLTVLLAAGHLLRDEAPEPLRAQVEQIVAQAERSRSIVRGLLAFARRLPVERRRVDLDQLVGEVLDVAEADLRLARITVEREVASGLPPVWADPGQIQQVLVNLVTNAKQAMAEHVGERRLRVSVGVSGGDAGRVQIRVRDTGPGIPPGLQLKVFDPFFTTKGAGGTGLGLSISHGIIEEHGGKLSVESAPGLGATFTIELPAGGPTEPSPNGADAATRPALAGQRVLIVESDPEVRTVLHGYVSAAGLEAVVAADAGDALARMAADVAMVITDDHLPDADGLDLHRVIVARHPALRGRILLMASGPIDEAELASSGEPTPRVLRKPFTEHEVVTAIAETLASSAAHLTPA
jgi:signal transduction histidine kinase/ActR/RegA family two-component response regulator